MPFSRWHRPPGGLYARAGSGAEDACGPFPSSVMQALRGVLHAWVELEEDWTSVPPITRPVPPDGLPQRHLSVQPPCQLKKKDNLLVFNNYI